MNTILIAAVIAAGPMSVAIEQACPKPVPQMSVQEWQAQVVGNTTIELPTTEAIETGEYERHAPANYKMPMPTKTVPRWCPQQPQSRHGYNCGMVQAVEDLAGHLQSVHGITLERLNQLGRDKWQSLHDDQHWAQETDQRKQLFLHPQPAVQAAPVVRSQCGPGGCPTGTCGRSRGFF